LIELVVLYRSRSYCNRTLVVATLSTLNMWI